MLVLQKLALSGLMVGVLSGCGSKAAVNDTFALSTPRVEDGLSARNRQILIADPSAVKALDSEQIVVRIGVSEMQYLAASQWSDRLPKLVQAKLVEAFENTGKVGGVGKPGQGLAIDFQVVTDIRAFEVQTDGADTAVVEISAKILNDRTGTVKVQRVFRATHPVEGTGNTAFIRALNAAFGSVTADIIGWTLKAI